MSTPLAPRVSVGMPVYNGERYLRAALESLLAQEYDDFELIISDNGSTDGTQAICLEAATVDPRVRYYRVEENQGAAWNFNRVAELARGEFFRWACHDDLCDPRLLGACVEAFDAASPSVVLVYTGSVLIDAHGQPTAQHQAGLDTHGLPAHARFGQVAQHLTYVNALYGLLRLDALRATRGMGAYSSADYVLMAELSLLGEFVEIPGDYFLRRVHPQMSRQANRTPRSVAAWFDPRSQQRVQVPHSKLLWEYANAVRLAPLRASERVRTAFELRHWARRSAKPLLRELRAAMLPSARMAE